MPVKKYFTPEERKEGRSQNYWPALEYVNV